MRMEEVIFSYRQPGPEPQGLTVWILIGIFCMITFFLSIFMFVVLIFYLWSKNSWKEILSIFTFVFLLCTLVCRTLNIIDVLEDGDIINGDGSQETLYSCSNMIYNTFPYFFFANAAFLNIMRWTNLIIELYPDLSITKSTRILFWSKLTTFCIQIYALIIFMFLLGINCSLDKIDQYSIFDLWMNLVAYYSYILIHLIVICCYIADLFILRYIMWKFYSEYYWFVWISVSRG